MPSEIHPSCSNILLQESKNQVSDLGGLIDFIWQKVGNTSSVRQLKKE